MKKDQILHAAPGIMITVAVVWMLGFFLVMGLNLIKSGLFDRMTNIFELVYGFVLGVILLRDIQFSRRKYIIAGTALAVFSWTLGQLFWFSYTSLSENLLPYPSVADMGYTGTYLLLIGVMGLILNQQTLLTEKWHIAVFFSSMTMPIVLLLHGRNATAALMYNFILGAAISLAVIKAYVLLKTSKYRWFATGIFLLGLTDILFMVSVSLFPGDVLLISDALYPVSLSLIAFDIWKGERTASD